MLGYTIRNIATREFLYKAQKHRCNKPWSSATKIELTHFWAINESKHHRCHILNLAMQSTITFSRKSNVFAQNKFWSTSVRKYNDENDYAIIDCNNKAEDDQPYATSLEFNFFRINSSHIFDSLPGDICRDNAYCLMRKNTKNNGDQTFMVSPTRNEDSIVPWSNMLSNNNGN